MEANGLFSQTPKIRYRLVVSMARSETPNGVFTCRKRWSKRWPTWRSTTLFLLQSIFQLSPELKAGECSVLYEHASLYFTSSISSVRLTVFSAFEQQALEWAQSGHTVQLATQILYSAGVTHGFRSWIVLWEVGETVTFVVKSWYTWMFPKIVVPPNHPF